MKFVTLEYEVKNVWNDIYQEVIQVFLLASTFTIILAIFAMFIVWYFKYKKNIHLPVKTRSIVLGSLFVIYLLTVLGITLFTRNTDMGTSNTELFSSYVSAWNRASSSEWKMIIYNIIMFVPLGIFLPLLHKEFQKLSLVILIGLMLTCFIEVNQYMTFTGVFEFDDILNNVVGTMIGWGISLAFIEMVLSQEETKRQKMIVYFAPLCFSVLFFVSLWGYYHIMPYGTLKTNYYFVWNTENIQFTSDINLNDSPTIDYVYDVIELSNEEMLSHASYYLNLFNQSDASLVLGKGVATAQLNQGEFQMYEDGHFTYRQEGIVNLQVNEWQVSQALKELKLVVSDDFLFCGISEGVASYEVPFITNEEGTYSGIIEVMLDHSGKVIWLNWDVKQITQIEQVEIKSHAQAWREIRAGEFLLYDISHIDTIHLVSSSRGHVIDSKGYYQPVYQFNVIVNDVRYSEFIVSAIK